jgi:hypothetical protein
MRKAAAGLPHSKSLLRNIVRDSKSTASNISNDQCFQRMGHLLSAQSQSQPMEVIGLLHSYCAAPAIASASGAGDVKIRTDKGRVESIPVSQNGSEQVQRPTWASAEKAFVPARQRPVQDRYSSRFSKQFAHNPVATTLNTRLCGRR